MTNEMLRKIPKKSMNCTFTCLFGGKFKGVALVMYLFFLDIL